jgi:hypothetical protein
MAGGKNMSGQSQDLKAIIDKLRSKFEQPAPTHGTVLRCTPDAGSPLPDLSASGSKTIALITMRGTRDDLINMATANQQLCAVSDKTRALFELDT